MLTITENWMSSTAQIWKKKFATQEHLEYVRYICTDIYTQKQTKLQTSNVKVL